MDLNPIDWLINLLLKPLVDFVNNDFFNSAFQNVFYIERMIGLQDGLIDKVSLYICGFAWFLLTLKLLHKLANVYFFGLDGDDTTSPFSYLKSYAKGVVIILCFTVVYSWAYDIVSDMGRGILALLGTQKIEASIFTNLFLQNVFMLIYLIMACVVYIHFLMNGCRLLVLRLGMPFACVGLIDSDNGIYTIFIRKIIQTCATVLVQLFLVRLSIMPISALKHLWDLPYLNVMMSVAIMAYSLRVTQDLNEIFLSSAASGMGSKASSFGRGVKSLVGAFRK